VPILPQTPFSFPYVDVYALKFLPLAAIVLLDFNRALVVRTRPSVNPLASGRIFVEIFIPTTNAARRKGSHLVCFLALVVWDFAEMCGVAASRLLWFLGEDD